MSEKTLDEAEVSVGDPADGGDSFGVGEVHGAHRQSDSLPVVVQHADCGHNGVSGLTRQAVSLAGGYEKHDTAAKQTGNTRSGSRDKTVLM